MKLIIDHSIKELLDDFNIIAYEVNLFAKATNKTSLFDELLNPLKAKLIKDIKYEEITKDEKLKETRDGYKKLGKDPSHTRPACEALLRRIIKDTDLYRLGDAIDLGNILSLMTLRSVCVVDYDKLVGDVIIRLGTSKDRYEGINRGLINVDKIPVYTDSISAFGCPTSDSLRTMVTEDTTRLLVMVICFNHQRVFEDELALVSIYERIGQLKKIIIEEEL